MAAITQKEKAIQFRQLHTDPDMLVLPNAWDAASARILEQAGFQAIATTSSGVAASLGYPDGQHISREMLLSVVENITRVIACPVSIDLEAGFGNTIDEVAKTVKAIIKAGAIGINIEDTTKQGRPSLVDIAYQVELLKAIQEVAASMDVALVINARTDIYLLPGDDAASRFEQAVERANAYLQAGADCAFPIGVSDAPTIARLVKAIAGPINVIAGSPAPDLSELARLGVARVTFASGLMRATLGHLHHIARELLTHGTYSSMDEHMLDGKGFRSLFEAR
ncbi:MAG TPA: isocitrate lyase/phosphoenolpyruvate mutase family protein [Ktedonobacteraceae bacterium]|nr:isocitrate lyase/phosphoenolpyruvate mutase family protein [Ktedonobacteraceae bacterium]